MKWKFWEKTQKQEDLSRRKTERLPRPKSIPDAVGRYLVVNMGKNPDWVWNLRGAIRKREDKKDAFDFRIFDEAMTAAQKISVKDYTYLDPHPDLILFEGWFDKQNFAVHIEDKRGSTPISKAA
jgi:hypothetical protein